MASVSSTEGWRPGRARREEAIGAHTLRAHAPTECDGLIGANGGIEEVFSFAEAGNFVIDAIMKQE